MAYGYIVSMKTKPGHRDDVVSIMLSGQDGLRQAGCQLYVVGVSDTDDVTIWVTEVWGSKEQHDASLETPEARAVVDNALPLLTGEYSGQEVTVLGGLGV